MIMPDGDVRQMDPRTGKMVCVSCLHNPNIDQMPMKVVLSHDGGDGMTPNHCVRCGSGGILGRSDGTVECTFCHLVFTVRVQPQHINSPQTVDGQPVHIPGMPNDEGAPGGATAPLADPAAEEAPKTVPGISDSDIPGEDEVFQTTAGHRLDRTAYVQHLALNTTSTATERDRLLNAVLRGNQARA